MAQVLEITGHFVGTYPETAAKAKQLENALTAFAHDWLRFNLYTWLVRTDLEPIRVYEQLKPHLATYDSILIIRVNLAASNRYGQAMNWVWNWLNRYS
jgi:hypothetical protein